VTGVRSSDYLLYGLQQQMVQFTGQADLKGSIIITPASSSVSSRPRSSSPSPS